MRQKEDLRKLLQQLDKKSYKAYKQLEGIYDFEQFTVLIDYVQGDPFASPSQLAVRIGFDEISLPEDTYLQPSRAIALRDFMSRQFARACRQHSDKRGTGDSGRFSMPFIGQEILERNAVLLPDNALEIRFNAGLPARGRSILGLQAEQMLCEELPVMVRENLYFEALDQEQLYQHIKTAEDADALRSQLEEKNLACFVADGAILPRRSGVDQRPLQQEAVPFSSPDSLRVQLEAPHAGRISGMGLPRGISLIVGGGYHGKSTLLRAISLGVYNHLPGDGRERVVTLQHAMKIRAEDERSVSRVNISPFINNLPFRQSTEAFSTPNASGSTSQAANIMEALEAGAELLLIDEDTSATNFMIRDHRMQELIRKEQEPITPFIDKVKQLYHDHGVSTIMVMGGSGDYFDVADTVIGMHEFQPQDLSREAKAISEKYQTHRKQEGGATFGMIGARIIDNQCLDPSRGKKSVKIKVSGTDSISYGSELIDVRQVEQLADQGQLKSIAEAMVYLFKQPPAGSLSQQLDRLEDLLNTKGLDALSPKMRGDLARFRKLELAATINRFRKLKIKDHEG
ncbi:MAG: ABC-ATPase domain-containing protein [Cyclobacteriaceae bacterium]